MALRCGDLVLELGSRPYVMGIVNVTPDSFSDGGRYLEVEAAYAHGMQLLAEGADLLDLGAESTRPGAEPISAEEELHRLAPVVERFVAAGVTALSIDTYKPAVAAAMLDLGAAWVNDVTGLADPAMLELGRRADGLVVMHQRPMSAGKLGDDVVYGDVVEEVAAHLADLVARAVAGAVPPERLVLDPGIGFGKSVADNLALLAGLDTFRALGHAVLVGPSRKRFLGAISGAVSLEDRDAATLGACCAAVQHGADIVRVHRVSGVRAALSIVAAVRQHGLPDPA